MCCQVIRRALSTDVLCASKDDLCTQHEYIPGSYSNKLAPICSFSCSDKLALICSWQWLQWSIFLFVAILLIERWACSDVCWYDAINICLTFTQIEWLICVWQLLWWNVSHVPCRCLVKQSICMCLAIVLVTWSVCVWQVLRWNDWYVYGS